MPPNQTQQPISPPVSTQPTPQPGMSPVPPKKNRGLVIAIIVVVALLIFGGLAIGAVTLLSLKAAPDTLTDSLTDEQLSAVQDVITNSNKELLWKAPLPLHPDWTQISADGGARVYQYKQTTCALSTLQPGGLTALGRTNADDVLDDGVKWLAEGLGSTVAKTIVSDVSALAFKSTDDDTLSFSAKNLIIEQKYEGDVYAYTNGDYGFIIAVICNVEDYDQYHDTVLLPQIKSYKVTIVN